MANKILNIGQQTTNLLSNDNLIVYSDVSMKSKFNANATNVSFVQLPQKHAYYQYLIPEHGTILNNGEYLSTIYNNKNIPLSIYRHESDFNNDPIKLSNQLSIAILSSDQYIIDYMSYVNKMSLSKFRVEKNINVKAVQNALHNIFSWIPGERILNPEFGSTLYRHLYNGITEHNTEQIMAEIRKNISEWEPRVRLEQVKNISNIDDTENNTIRLEIIYFIPSLNTKQYSYTYVYHKQ